MSVLAARNENVGRTSPVEPTSGPPLAKSKLRKNGARGSSSDASKTPKGQNPFINNRERASSASLGSNRGASDDSDGSGLSNEGLAAGSSKKRSSSIRGNRLAPQRSRPVFSERENTRFEDFNMRAVIGQGSFGVVLLGTKQHGLACGEHFALKVVSKAVLKEAGVRMQRRLWTERNILVSMDHPNIGRLQFAFQTPSNVYLAFDCYNGGSLHYHIYRPCKPTMANGGQVKKGGLGFNDATVGFYAGEILMALVHMHRKGILHRDLKPGNIVIDPAGHARVIDFGCSFDAKSNIDATNERDFRGAKTLCGTNEYIAPEILAGFSYGKSADWWAFGVLLHEMSIANMPFVITKEKTRSEQSKELNLQLPIQDHRNLREDFSPRMTDLLTKLLHFESSKRLGSTGRGSETIKSAAFFEDMDWEKLEQRKVPPPFIPATAPDEVKYISRKYKKMTVEGVLDETNAREDQALCKAFRNFDYQNEAVRHFDNTPQVPVSGQAGIWSDVNANASTGTAAASGMRSGGGGGSGAAAIDETSELELGLEKDYPMDPLLEEIEAPRRPKKDDDGWGDWVDFLFCCGNSDP
uniref:non-specific serine/threonine protein kinase n=1 Tax=Florenciella parvula TaxID=236787 RepID=A0A7S2B0L1_9STRA|mmetsp:Transcript_11702/g.24621  ORF Transcript_11702/g.24621 Transcript_11702/m.24621 type:complete len:581 (+) Transcript_11702:219-1961(+)|eukprot:CAMPEP_0182543642 /NCGR_PEP_ID=MMETSP1323-20130603/31958_1 /TAXON_ID=236787 /ORGANISM="Florenciella parvula, Strain RCC1693" /LENGTH=580 /DNA_ID=CAMNT_0024754599 /DNA_START=198 /DNA_END=1940 /DNA_ORIENTATION=-